MDIKNETSCRKRNGKETSFEFKLFVISQIANGQKDLRAQAIKIEESLKNDPDFVKSYEESKKKAEARGEKFVPMNEREIVALIAYMQRLGTDIKVKDNK